MNSKHSVDTRCATLPLSHVREATTSGKNKRVNDAARTATLVSGARIVAKAGNPENVTRLTNQAENIT